MPSEFCLLMFYLPVLTDTLGVEDRRTAMYSKRHSTMLLERQIIPYDSLHYLATYLTGSTSFSRIKSFRPLIQQP